jgi:hypothetical protein
MLWIGDKKKSILASGNDIVALMWIGSVKMYQHGYFFTSDKKVFKTADGELFKPKE